MHVATRDHLWTNHEVRLENNQQQFFQLLIVFKSDLVVGPEVVYGKYMQCLII